MDVRTIFTIQVMIFAICAMFTVTLWWQNRRQIPATSWWLGNSIIQFIVSIVIVSHGLFPPQLIPVIDIPLIITGVYLQYFGVVRFFALRATQQFNLIYLAFVVLIHEFFLVVYPSLHARNINFSVAQIIITVQVIWIMQFCLKEEERRITRLLTAVLACSLLVTTIRLLGELRIPSGDNLMHAGVYDAMMLIALQTLYVAQTFALMLMVNSRLLHALESDIEHRRQAEEMLQCQLAEIAQLHTQLHEEAIRDSLTGLFNRRYMQETLVRELARATREEYPVSLLIFDIDQFKQLNDQFGHLAGDQALIAVSDLLRRETRVQDIACRFGGDEFLLIFPGSSLESVRSRAEDLCRKCEALRIPYREQTLQITISVGVAGFPEHGPGVDTLLRIADDALYQAKVAGRNCVRINPCVAENRAQ